MTELINYLKTTGKGNHTWQEIGDMFGYSPRRARYIWETYNNTPSSEEVEEYTDPLKGYSEIPASRNASGGITYRFVKETPSGFEQMKTFLTTVQPRKFTRKTLDHETTTVICIADVHIGMSTKDNPVQKEYLKERIMLRLEQLLNSINWDTNIHILFLGDYIDGEQGYTASRTHRLTQTMTDGEMFEVGLEFALNLVKEAHTRSTGTVNTTFLTNCNHNKNADEIVAIALSKFYPVTIERDFIATIELPIETVVTHGKDKQHRKFGMGVNLTHGDIRLLEQYIKDNKERYLIIRADRHLPTIQDKEHHIDIIAAPFCPSNGWVFTNFGSNYKGGTTVLEVTNNIIKSQIIYFND